MNLSSRRRLRKQIDLSLVTSAATKLNMARTKIALMGAGFIADIHIESYQRFVPDAEVVAVYTRDAKRAEAFAKKHHIAKWYTDYDQCIRESGCEVVDIGLPNFLH